MSRQARTRQDFLNLRKKYEAFDIPETLALNNALMILGDIDSFPENHPWNEYNRIKTELNTAIAGKLLRSAIQGNEEKVARMLHLDAAEFLLEKPEYNCLYFFAKERDGSLKLKDVKQPFPHVFSQYLNHRSYHRLILRRAMRGMPHDVLGIIEQYAGTAVRIDFLLCSAFTIKLLEQNKFTCAFTAIKSGIQMMLDRVRAYGSATTQQPDISNIKLALIKHANAETLLKCHQYLPFSGENLCNYVVHRIHKGKYPDAFYMLEKVPTPFSKCDLQLIKVTFITYGDTNALLKSHQYLHYSSADFTPVINIEVGPNKTKKDIMRVLSTNVQDGIEDTLANRYQTRCEMLIYKLLELVTTAKTAGNRGDTIERLLHQLNTTNKEIPPSRLLIGMLREVAIAHNAIRESFCGTPGLFFGNGSKTAGALRDAIDIVSEKMTVPCDFVHRTRDAGHQVVKIEITNPGEYEWVKDAAHHQPSAATALR